MRRRRRDEIVVVGLGRFGGSVAQALVEAGHEVLGVDNDEQNVQEWSQTLTHVVEADATDVDALRQLGVEQYRQAVVGIGAHVEGSVLSTASLAEVGVATIWAKAVSEQHARILRLVGAHHVVLPERDMGLRTAHMVSVRGHARDFMNLDEDFALLRCAAPDHVVGQSLEASQMRSRYGITVVCLTEGEGCFSYATPDSVVQEGAEMVIVGAPDKVEDFAAQAHELADITSGGFTGGRADGP